MESLADYISGKPVVVEVLNDAERYDENVFTALRTADGVDLHRLAQSIGQDRHDSFLCVARKHVRQGLMEEKDGRMRLTRNGIFVSNDVMSDFMMVE